MALHNNNKNDIIILIMRSPKRSSTMEISNDIRARIIDAADQLYQETNRERFPTVDQVRRAARADMNTTSAVMREWRKQQTATPVAVAVAIPERVQDAMSAALATVWSEAQELANESLTTAKQAWEIERADADAMRAELADAYEQQAQELAETAARLHELERRDQEARQRIEELRAELTTVKARAEAQQEAAADRQSA